jgi:hypothetical protein
LESRKERELRFGDADLISSVSFIHIMVRAFEISSGLEIGEWSLLFAPPRQLSTCLGTHEKVIRDICVAVVRNTADHFTDPYPNLSQSTIDIHGFLSKPDPPSPHLGFLLVNFASSETVVGLS